jgi:hypothetical protein
MIPIVCPLTQSLRVALGRALAVALAASVCLIPQSALAWGDEGHRIIALVTDRFLEPPVRDRVKAMLAVDPDDLTAHDIASEATWADRYRDLDRRGSRQHYEQTRRWHFVNIELPDANLDAACNGRPLMPPGTGTLASNGPAQACVADKIDQFTAELADPKTDPEERLVALKFVLHRIGPSSSPPTASRSAIIILALV